MDKPLYKQETYKGYTIKIMWDTDPAFPDWLDFGTFFSNCREFDPHNHRINELFCEDENGNEKLDDSYLCLPVYAYIHGGISLSTNRNGQFADKWDSGVAGYMAVEKDKIIKETGNLSDGAINKAYRLLECEVQEWDDYVQGNVFGFVIENSDGESVDSCWGYFGNPSDPMCDAKGTIDFLVKKEEKFKAVTEPFWID